MNIYSHVADETARLAANRVEAAIRAYDPCLSCSTHAIGQMPLLVEVRGAGGELVNRIQRD